MRRYYLAFGFLSLVVITVLVVGFIISGNPFTAKREEYDKIRLSHFTNIKSSIENYYLKNKSLPNTLLLLTDYDYKDPQTKKTYDYLIIDSTTYKLCTTFSTDNLTEKNSNPNDIQNTVPDDDHHHHHHKKGYDCISYSISDYYLNQVSPIPVISKSLQNSSFEFWLDDELKNWKLISGRINKVEDSHSGNYGVEFASMYAQIILTSSPLKIGTNINYETSFWYKTNSDCSDCAFIGYQFLDAKGKEIKDNITQCGKYNPFIRQWISSISGVSGVYKKHTNQCTVPKDTATFTVSLGILNESHSPWKFDDVNILPKNIPLYPNEISDTKPCSNALNNGMCDLPNCSYSYPNDIYTKGKIVVGEAFKKYGRPSGTFYDECSANKKSVTEMVCSGTSEGNYGEGGASYNCPNGCEDGACIE